MTEPPEAVRKALMAKLDEIDSHEGCKWEQIGPCVYCVDHRLRLYQGDLPGSRRPTCSEHDWDEESGLGFYMQCRICGVREWYE